MFQFKAFLTEIASGTALHTETIGKHTHLVTEDHSRVSTQFKAATITSASTATVVAPPAGNALVLTDLIVSAEKVAGGSITVQFTDGTNTIVIFKASLVDAPVAIAMPFAGRWRGWKDAKIDMVGVGTNIDADVSIGYYFIKGAGVLAFNQWDKLRG